MDSIKKRSKTESKIAQSNVNKEQKRNNGRVTTKHLFKSCAKACAALQLSHVPKSLPCREKERKQIMNFLKSAVERGGLGSALYLRDARDRKNGNRYGSNTDLKS